MVRIILSLLLVVFLGTETALRLFFPVYEKKLVIQSIPGLNHEVKYERNQYGFRTRSLNTKKKHLNTIRIISLGSSTTDQPYQNIEDMWSMLLENKLNDEFGKLGYKIELAARGREAETVRERLKWAREQLLDLRPDMVILLEGINDLRLKDSSRSGLSLSWMETCERLSQLCHRIHAVKKMFTDPPLPVLSLTNGGLPLRQEPDRVAQFSEGIGDLLRYLATNNIETVVIGQPTGSGGPLEKELMLYNDAQKAQALSVQATYLPLDKFIPKTPQYFFDEYNFTDKGSHAVASAVYPVVAQAIHRVIRKRALASN